MNYLYLLLDLGSLSIPFLYSFHPKLKFYKKWKSLGLAMICTMLFFIPWDVIFTNNGFWGFNETYFLKTRICNLPIEEWLFFICIPYACVFTHYALKYYLPNMSLSKKNTTIISSVLMLVLLVVTIFHYDKWYTLINFSFALFLIPIVYRYNIKLLQRYYFSFIVILFPFFLVNGILTGSFIGDEVVWYNNAENLGIRMGTIPIEDSIYAFTLILCNLFLLEIFEEKLFKKQSV